MSNDNSGRTAEIISLSDYRASRKSAPDDDEWEAQREIKEYYLEEFSTLLGSFPDAELMFRAESILRLLPSRNADKLGAVMALIHDWRQDYYMRTRSIV